MRPFLSDEEDVLNAFLKACNELGIDAKDALKSLDLAPSLLASPEKLVPSHLFNQLLEEVARLYHCHDLALRVAQQLGAPRLGLPGRLMAYSLDLRSGLNKAEHYAVYYQDTGYWQQHTDNGLVTLSKQPSPFASEYNHQRNLLGTAQLFLLLRQITGGFWQASQLSFSFPDPGGKFTDTFRAFFRCELRFSQPSDAIHFAEEYLDTDLSTADPGALKSLENQISAFQAELLGEQAPLGRARLLLDQRLRFASCDFSELAFYMGISKEALRQTFRDAASSFDEFRRERQAERAQYYERVFHAPTALLARAIAPEASDALMARLGKTS
ncbi:MULTISPECIES: AraC family transcriptional regulator ligand-binding domain-containing protein [Spongiibacter]|uniref:AraC family transcriptional regulator ligand-binding domain-containing protein n=2 Tax=Spongiibacteraceae TaxID=1706375 RepID=UPI000C508336|nr:MULTISPECIES: AraC family transcriptional regulator ligand-binding domain-containing protein [Spongiibacter]MAY38206.1 hypothetical protein [Spongiibacter sp.]|tara:strand:+ start:30357 stop:31337 length:981 start_codon:yes stop_codon:yes gene_type:complete